MIEKTIINYKEFHEFIKDLLKEGISITTLENDIIDQVYTSVIEHDLSVGDMVSGIEISSGLTKSGNTILIDFINIEKIELDGDHTLIKVRF